MQDEIPSYIETRKPWLFTLGALVQQTEARAELSHAQELLRENYTDYIWRERVAASTPVPKSSKGWPHVRLENAKPSNVLPLAKGRK